MSDPMLASIINRIVKFISCVWIVLFIFKNLYSNVISAMFGVELAMSEQSSAQFPGCVLWWVAVPLFRAVALFEAWCNGLTCSQLTVYCLYALPYGFIQWTHLQPTDGLLPLCSLLVVQVWKTWIKYFIKYKSWHFGKNQLICISRKSFSMYRKWIHLYEINCACGMHFYVKVHRMTQQKYALK